MNDEKSARTKLDLLFHETLGDVAGLIERTERTSDKLRETATGLIAAIDVFAAANQQLQTLPDDLARALGAVLEQAGSDITDQVAHTVDGKLSPIRAELKLLSNEASRYARYAHASARKMALLALGVGASAGAGATVLIVRLLTQ